MSTSTVIPLKKLLPNIKIYKDILITYSTKRVEVYSLISYTCITVFDTDDLSRHNIIDTLLLRKKKDISILSMYVLNRNKIIFLTSGIQHVLLFDLNELSVKMALLDDYVMEGNFLKCEILNGKLKMLYGVTGGLAMTKIDLENFIVEDVEQISGKGILVGANFEGDSVWNQEEKIIVQQGKHKTILTKTGHWIECTWQSNLCLVIQGNRFEPWFGQDPSDSNPCTITFVKASKAPVTIDTTPFHHFVDDLLVTFSETAVMFTDLEPNQMGTVNIKGEVLSISHEWYYIQVLCSNEGELVLHKLNLRKSSPPVFEFAAYWDILQPNTPYDETLQLFHPLIFNSITESSLLYPPAPGWSSLRHFAEPLPPLQLLYLLFESHGPLSETSLKMAKSFSKAFGIDPNQFKTIHAYWCLDHGHFEQAINLLISPFCARPPPSIWTIIFEKLFSQELYTSILSLTETNQLSTNDFSYQRSLLKCKRIASNVDVFVEYFLSSSDIEWLPPCKIVFHALDIVLKCSQASPKYLLIACKLAFADGWKFDTSPYQHLIDDKVRLFMSLIDKIPLKQSPYDFVQEHIYDQVISRLTTPMESKVWSSPALRRIVSSSLASTPLPHVSSPQTDLSPKRLVSSPTPRVKLVKSPAAKKRSITISPTPQIIDEDQERRRPYAVHQPSRLSTVHTTGSSESIGKEEKAQVEVENELEREIFGEEFEEKVELRDKIVSKDDIILESILGKHQITEKVAKTPSSPVDQSPKRQKRDLEEGPPSSSPKSSVEGRRSKRLTPKKEMMQENVDILPVQSVPTESLAPQKTPSPVKTRRLSTPPRPKTPSPAKSQWINYSPRGRGRPKKVVKEIERAPSDKKKSPPSPPTVLITSKSSSPTQRTPPLKSVTSKPISVRKIMASPKRNLQADRTRYDLRTSTLEGGITYRPLRKYNKPTMDIKSPGKDVNKDIPTTPQKESSRRIAIPTKRRLPSPKAPVPTPPSRKDKSTSKFAVNTIRSSPRFH